MPRSRVTGVVLAAGVSRRLGTPKQLLPLGDTTVLGATLNAARSCPFDQLIVTLGGAAAVVREAVKFDGIDVVIADNHEIGCSSSLRTALSRVDPSADGIVLMLGDQPGVTREAVARLIDSRRGARSPCVDTPTESAIRSGWAARCSANSPSCTATRVYGD